MNAVDDLDVNALAAEWLRALRGRRTQRVLSRRLGYRSNIVYRWESQRCFPAASHVLGLIAELGGDVRLSLNRFYRRVPTWLETVDPASTSGVAVLLDDLRGKATLMELAARTGYSRFAIARWLKGRSEPTLPQFLRLLDKISHRLLDFIASFTDPELLPSAREAWRLLVAARQAAYDQPWSNAILRGLELDEYRALSHHEPGWLAARLGISPSMETQSFESLERSGQVHWTGTHFRPVKTGLVDTRTDPERARQLRAWWAKVAIERLQGGTPGLLAYNLSVISQADFKRIEQLQRAHYRQMVSIIAESLPGECVVLYGAQLVDLCSKGISENLS